MADPASQINREAWMMGAIAPVRTLFDAAGEPLPQRLRVSCCPPRGVRRGATQRHRCQCWPSWNSADRTWELFMSASLDDSLTVAAELVAGLVHVKTGPDCGLRFQALADAVGLTIVGGAPLIDHEPLIGLMHYWMASAGPYPHAALAGRAQGSRAHPSQLLRAACPQCGYPAWTTARWMRRALPICGICLIRSTLDARDAERLARPPAKRGRPRKHPPPDEPCV